MRISAYLLQHNMKTILKDIKDYFFIRSLERYLNSHLRRVARPALYPDELSSQRGLVASLIQFKCTKYFRNCLTLVFGTRTVSILYIRLLSSET